tara:strand:- start:5117 stop:5875 length:759 start_codon:yes stop_codon:yes gene_type:complete
MVEKQFTGHLKGRIALVTGGCGGIGQAICSRFHNDGAHVIAADIASLLASLKGLARYFKHDVTSEQSAQDLMTFVGQEFSQLDVLMNAAGIEIETTIEETTLDDWQRIFAINVTGTFLTSKYGVPLMRKNGAGSYDSFIADPGLAAYCATNGAVHALTKAMACDYGKEHIRVNAICPGYVATPMLESFFGESGDLEGLKQEVCDIHPLRRYGTPDDMANLVNWLEGDEARYASGALWVLDGGLSAQVQQMRL